MLEQITFMKELYYVAIFYGGNTDSGYTDNTVGDALTRINDAGVSLLPHKTIGTPRISVCSAGIKHIGMFFAGIDSNGDVSTLTRTNIYGHLLSAEINTARAGENLAGTSILDRAFVYAHSELDIYDQYGTLLSTVTDVGVNRSEMAAVTYSDRGLFFGGNYITTHLTFFNVAGTLLSDNTVTANERARAAGVGFDNVGVIYGGNNGLIVYSTLSLIGQTGAFTQEDLSVATDRYRHGGGRTNSSTVFYAGATAYTHYDITNLVTRISKTGTMVASEIALDSARYKMAGTSVL